MHGVGRREQKKQETRQRISAAAQKLFYGHGYQETTLADIAAEAGVSPRTIFSYFPSKESIVFYERDHIVQDLKNQLAIPDRPVVEIIRNFAHEAYGCYSADEKTGHLALITSDKELLEQAHHRQLELEEAIVAAFARELGLPTSALLPELAAASIRVAVRRAFEVHTQEDPLRTVDDCLRFIQAGLRAF